MTGSRIIDLRFMNGFAFRFVNRHYISKSISVVVNTTDALRARYFAAI